jgi:hypothetical protein
MNRESCLPCIRSFTLTEDALDYRLIDTTGSQVFFTASVTVSTLEIMLKAQNVMGSRTEIEDMNTDPNS